jgi:hypothetical protein
LQVLLQQVVNFRCCSQLLPFDHPSQDVQKLKDEQM